VHAATYNEILLNEASLNLFQTVKIQVIVIFELLLLLKFKLCKLRKKMAKHELVHEIFHKNRQENLFLSFLIGLCTRDVVLELELCRFFLQTRAK